jgi:membrane associated rhomboid family serine protease
MPRFGQVEFSLGPPITPMVKKLIIVTSAIFVLTWIPLQIFNSDFFALPFAWFSLQANDVVYRFYFWELGTYLFLHGGWFHILFNMYALWVFGSDLESLWKGKKFLFYYFLTGIGAGIFDVALTKLFGPAHPLPTIGCSGAVYGLLLAYGMLFSERIILWSFIIPIKAKWFAVLMGVIEFVSSFGGSGSGVSHFAHLGGMLFGYFYLRGWSLPYRWQLQYHEWRRAQLRKKFEVYMRDHEKKDDPGRWVN